MAIDSGKPTQNKKGKADAARPAQASPRQPLLIHVALGLTLLLAAGLRFYRLAGQSLWSDEGNSVALAQVGLSEIAARTAFDIHPPLYYWLLHAWIRFFGRSEVAVRSLSVVVGVLLVAVVYQLGKQLFDSRVGLLAAFIAAVSPFLVYYSQEARMYALLALFGAVVVWATVGLMSHEGRVTRDEEPRRSKPATRYFFLLTYYSLLYVVFVTLGLYTHYAFPLVLVATNVAFLTHLWRTRGEGSFGSRLAGWLLLQLIPLTLYLPWLPIAWRQLTTWPAPSSESGNALVILWRTLVLGPVGERANSLWLVVFGLLGLVGVVRLMRRGTLPQVALFLLYLGLPVVLTLILFRPAYLKFLLVASPALCLLLALALTKGSTKKGVPIGGWLVAGLVVLAAWMPLMASYTDPTVARDDYRGMARYLEAVAGPEDAIILNAAGQQEVFGYYYDGDTPVHPLPRRRPLDPDATLAELEEILARSRRIFTLYWATDESDPTGVIEGWLDRHTFKASDVWMGNVRLISYATPLPAGDLQPADIHLGDHVTLTGYQLLLPIPDAESADGLRPSSTSPVSIVPGEIVQVQLRWTTDVPLDVRYRVFVQALDGANHLVGQRDAEPLIPTLDWTPGRPVLDRHGLLIELGTPPGEYRVVAGLYDAVTGQRLPTANGDFVELGNFNVERPAIPPPTAALPFHHPANVDFGPLRLLGYDRYKLGFSHDPDTLLNPGDPVHVVLYWQAHSQPQADWRLALQLAPVADPAAPVAQAVFPTAGVDYPTTGWEPGEVVRAQFDIFLPTDAAPGDYIVTVRLLDETGSPGMETLSLFPISVE
jgi:mannosyltransferase